MSDERIAIIGMSGRFPKADGPRAFWENLLHGVDGITRFTPDELEVRHAQNGGAHAAARGILEDAEFFDAAFFGIPRPEAELIDPQHRVFLECAWEALEDAGYVPDACPGLVGVFGGLSLNTYFLHQLCSRPGYAARFASLLQAGEFGAYVGGDKDFLTTRVSYRLNLRGPSLAVQTACSSSLVAVSQACDSLLNWQCDIALAGGVSITFPQRRDYPCAEDGMVSEDGCCRAFDAAANGTVFGHGAGIVVLKRLSEAMADGDNVLAVILGTAVNNDGSAKVGFAAPSVEGQAEVITLAQAAAGVHPDDVSYIEAHGTGTPLGDPIEAAGLIKAFRERGARGIETCLVGTAKPSIGHLDAAAGVTGLIKTVLQIRSGLIPPILHFREPNPRIPFAGSPFRPASELIEWNPPGGRRIAGVTSLGVGGTNAHVIVAGPPPQSPRTNSRRLQIFPISARTESALEKTALRLAERLEDSGELIAADVAFTLQEGRRAFPVRRTVIAATAAEAAALLRQRGRTIRAKAGGPMVFVFPGHGCQSAGMGGDLYAAEPVFRETIDACRVVLERLGGWKAAPHELTACDLESPAFAQPAIFSLELALARLWMSKGFRPAAVLGHSAGEFAAAVVAGYWTLDEALEVLWARAGLLETLAPGAMLAVRLSRECLAEFLTADVEVAAENSSRNVTVAGPRDAIERLAAKLAAASVPHQPVASRLAFHSAMMDPALAGMESAAARFPGRMPGVPWISSLTGALVESPPPASYWARQLRERVRFSEAVRVALEHSTVFAEAGPGRNLCPMVLQNAPIPSAVAAIPMLPDPAAGTRGFLEAAGTAWAHGVLPDWTSLRGAEPVRRVSLPAYPFERERFWIDSESVPAPLAPEAPPPVQPAPGIRAALADLLRTLSGVEIDDGNRPFTEYGLDSLFLTQLGQAVESRFGVRVTFRQLVRDLATLNAVAEFLEKQEDGGPVRASAPAALRGPSGRAVVWPDEKPPGARSGRFGPFRPVEKTAGDRWPDRQHQALERWMERYISRTAGSKRHTALHRAHFADPRTVAGFNPRWKEMVYPIVVDRSFGSKVIDIDGNEYVDVTMGFGAYFFGHSPDFVVDAVNRQLARGMEIGPQNEKAGRLAREICRLSGQERATFCNTGSEGVMAAIRLARTATGRKRIVSFGGDYHGLFDEVLARGSWVDGTHRPVPAAPGIPEESVANVVVLEYGDRRSIRIIREHADEIAAVIVEPVQGRHPGLQPADFLRELQTSCRTHDVPLIFDEVVTGFRSHPGGAQAWFGVKADMVVYGKVIGGGLPIGVLAGRARFLDALDGGHWTYGDDSAPETGMTFFAGTFVRHPLAMAAVEAVLRHLHVEGPGLQVRMAERTARLMRALNSGFRTAGVPFEFEHFSSWAWLEHGADPEAASLLWYLLREKGIHWWEGRPLHLTTAHSDEDFDKILRAFGEATHELQDAGLLPGGRNVFPAAFPREDRAPTTEAQREVLSSAQISADASRAYNESVTLFFTGPLNGALFRKTFHQIVERHASLRSSFSEDRLEQIFHPEVPARAFREEDLSALPPPERTRALDAVRAAATSTVFDLESGPLIAAVMVRLGASDHALVLTAHHAVCDGWSLGMIIEELSKTYSALAAGDMPLLPPPASFGDYARRSAMQGTRSEDRRYWLERFREPAAPVKLPTDRERTAGTSFRGALETLVLDADLVDRLIRAAPRLGGTLFSTLLSVYAVLLRRLSSQDDLVIGVPLAGQTLAGSNELIGHCVHFLPLRLKCEGTFREFSASAGRSVLDAFEHGSETFGGLVQALKLSRGGGSPPLVSVAFNIDRAGFETLVFEGLEFRVESNAKQFVQFDLFFNLLQSGNRLEIECEFNTDLFDRATASRFLRLFETLARAAVEEPDMPVDSLPMLSEDELQKLVAWSGWDAKDPAQATVGGIFESVAAAHPESIAVVQGGKRVTYRELRDQAREIGWQLRGQGIRPGDVVAVVSGEAPEIVASLAGILLAGAAYLPVENHWPASRIADLLEAAEAKVVLSLAAHVAKVPAGAWKVLVPETATHDVPPLPDALAQAGLPAYVLFTSGSEGRPKGVVVPHRGIVRLVCETDYIDFRADDVFLQAAPLAFDASTFEIWGALLNGATLALLPPGGYALDRIIAAVQTEKVSVLWLTAGLFQMMIDEHPESLRGLRCLLAGGDVLSVPHLRRARAALPGTRLINGYGPTENTTFTTCHTITDADLAGEAVPIGRPIRGTSVFVLDTAGLPAPMGSEGEICTGGAGLALRYLGDDSLTAAKFRRHVVPGVGEIELYHTGDRGRWRADGVLEFLGRQDRQVKIRGVRVEPGESEALLLGHPGVVQCRVAVRGHSAGTRSLIAWIRCEPGVGRPEIETYIAEHLPGFLRPDALVFLDEFPLTENGKIHEALLPDPDPASHIRSGPPVTATEKKLGAIWSELLGVPLPGRDDNFFHLGGHSLLALQMFSRVQTAFGVALPLATLLKAPTLRTLGSLLDGGASGVRPRAQFGALLAVLQPEGSAAPLFCVHGAGGGVLFYRPLANRLPHDRPFVAIEARAEWNPPGSIEETAEIYVRAIRARQASGPYLLGGYSFGGVVAFEMARQLEAAGEEVAMLVLIDSLNPELDSYSRAGRLRRIWNGNEPSPWPVRAARLARYIFQRWLARFRALPEVREGDMSDRTNLEAYGRRIEALMNYRPGPFGGNVHLLRASESDDIMEPPADYGWSGLCKKLRVHVVPARHDTIMETPAIDDVAAALAKAFPTPERVEIRDLIEHSA